MTKKEMIEQEEFFQKTETMLIAYIPMLALFLLGILKGWF